MEANSKFHADVFVETDQLSHDEWIQYRRNGIGGSDLAAICGISKYKTPLHVYLEKVGEAPEDTTSEAAEWGTRLEPLIADKFASEHPEWAITEKKVIYCHPNQRWALGNLDRMIICPERGRGILEIKTASEYLRHEWDNDNIPDYYYIQLQWYLLVTGLDWGYFATLIGGGRKLSPVEMAYIRKHAPSMVEYINRIMREREVMVLSMKAAPTKTDVQLVALKASRLIEERPAEEREVLAKHLTNAKYEFERTKEYELKPGSFFQR